MDRPSGQRTRRRLLDAAAQLIAELGWGRVTTRAVADHAGLPHGAVSYHFPGKQALLTEAAMDLVERSFPIEELRDAESLAGLVSLMHAWAGGPAPADQLGGGVLMEAMREAGRDPNVRDRLAALLVDYRRAVADLVHAGQHNGQVPAGIDPEALATLLAAAGDGLLLHAMLDPAVDLTGAVQTLEALLHHAGRSGDERQIGRLTSGRGGRR